MTCCMAQEIADAFWLDNPKIQVISRKDLVFPVGRFLSPQIACLVELSDYPSHCLDLAMANPSLPICNSPEIDISTPLSSSRTRSERIGNAPASGAVALDSIQVFLIEV